MVLPEGKKGGQSNWAFASMLQISSLLIVLVYNRPEQADLNAKWKADKEAKAKKVKVY